MMLRFQFDIIFELCFCSFLMNVIGLYGLTPLLLTMLGLLLRIYMLPLNTVG